MGELWCWNLYAPSHGKALLARTESFLVCQWLPSVAVRQEANSAAQTIHLTCLAVQPGDLSSCYQHRTKQPEAGLRLSRARRMITNIWNGFLYARITHLYICTFIQRGLYIYNCDFTSSLIVCSLTHKRYQNSHQNVFLINLPRTNQSLREMRINPYQERYTLTALHQFSIRQDGSVNVLWRMSSPRRL